MSEAQNSASEPWAVLDVSPEADCGQIRKAYLAKIQKYPPDRNPAEFEKIRDAYEELRDPIRRTQRMLLSVDPQASVSSLLEEGYGKRRFVGIKPWLAVLEK